MRLNEFYQKLLAIALPAFRTQDVAVLYNITNQHASQLLRRLGESRQVLQIKRGVWILPDKIERLGLPYFLTMPAPSYISLQSALSYHGMIMQMPEVVYAISIARTRSYHTLVGAISIHHVMPEMFFGYDEIAPYINMASPEKALVDFFYFHQAKSRKFVKLPELELPAKFNMKLMKQYIEKISSPKRRQKVLSLLNELMIQLGKV
jgi:predicted transcriptional regulator of viral defense system